MNNSKCSERVGSKDDWSLRKTNMTRREGQRGTHKSTISIAMNAALMDKDILCNGTSLRGRDEPVPLFVGEPLHAALNLFRHGVGFTSVER